METILLCITIMIVCAFFATRKPFDYVEPKCKMHIIPGLIYRHITSGKEVLVTESYPDKVTRYKIDGNEYSMQTKMFRQEFELLCERG